MCMSWFLISRWRWWCWRHTIDWPLWTTQQESKNENVICKEIWQYQTKFLPVRLILISCGHKLTLHGVMCTSCRIPTIKPTSVAKVIHVIPTWSDSGSDWWHVVSHWWCDWKRREDLTSHKLITAILLKTYSFNQSITEPWFENAQKCTVSPLGITEMIS